MAGDSAKHALRRQLLLAPAMDSFVRAVRVKEGFLSSAQVVTHQPMNKHNQLMHSLGKAMLEMGLIGARQSRAVAWSTFSQSVAAEAQKRWEKHLHHGQSEKVAWIFVQAIGGTVLANANTNFWLSGSTPVARLFPPCLKEHGQSTGREANP